MNKFLSLLIVTIIFNLRLQAQISTPLPSPAGSVSSTVGLTNIKIDYFRPKMKGRKIFGKGEGYLVPFGKTWRSGANSGSKISFSTDVMIGDKNVAPGEYMIYTIPGAKDWTFMLYSDMSLGGNVNAYDESAEVTRITVKSIELGEKIKTLTINISDISEDNTSANIELAWENTSIKVPISVDYHDVVMKDIANKTKVNPNNLVSAARYYNSINENLEQALLWMDEYLAEENNSDQFWNLYVKAEILSKLGKKKEAIAVAEDSKMKASNSPAGDFGYVKRNETLIKSLSANK